MKKHFLLIALLALIVFTADAQRRRRSVSSEPKLAVAADLLLPVGDASDAYSVGYGATLKLEIPIATATHFTANVGYARLQYTDEVKQFFRALGSDRSGDGFVPLLAGVKHYVSNQFFIEGQLGAAIAAGDGGGGTAFAYSPGLGFTLPAGDGNAFDVGVRYEGWSKNGDIGMFGLRLAYKFGL